MHDIFSLRGKVALVTGASRGLGRAMAEGLASRGAAVVLAARDPRCLEEAVGDLRNRGWQADSLAFDLCDEAAVTAAIPQVVERHGRLDILLNNAGICQWAGLLDSSLGDWNKTLAVNMTAVFLLCREAARVMVEQRSGRIINVSSYVADIGRERLQAYVASKHGVTGLTRSLAGELGRHNITANCIAPGLFITDMSEPVRRDPGKMDVFTKAIAMARWGAPEELVGAAVFLASEASSYVNGQTLHVDGGLANTLCLQTAIDS